ncbi:MAG: FAD-binding protein, partial [Novosphingobium sp.]|nr:FAD-binding protein [Novosphingobium sp.]
MPIKQRKVIVVGAGNAALCAAISAAENGAQVPVSILVDSPQTEALHVRSIQLIATRNPTPWIA